MLQAPLPMRLSVIVPAYNEEASIVELLRRVRAQSVSGVEIEIVVVDDGSKDGTLALLEKNAGLYDQLVKQGKNGGKAVAARLYVR